MNEHGQMIFLRIVGGKTVILACDLIGVETTSIRPQDEDMLRDGIDELSQLSFALPELFLRILLLNGHGREMSDLPDEVLMLLGRVTRLTRVNREGAQYCFIRRQYWSGPTSPQSVCHRQRTPFVRVP